MNITDIYTKYKIMPFLQLHHFRAAALAKVVCDNFSQPISTKDVVTAMLLHDIGNIVKFRDLSRFPESVEPEGIEYWERVRAEFIEKYGEDEDEAHNKIVAEIGVNDRVAYLVDAVGFSNMCETKELPDWERKICQYADERIGPHGIMSVKERLEEGRKRYEIEPKQERWDLVNCAVDIEHQIFQHCNLKPEEITDEVLAPIIEELRGWKVETNQQVYVDKMLTN